MSGTVEAPLSTETTGIKPDTTTPTTPPEQSIYALTAQFDERTRFTSSIDALKQDPAYQAVVAMGEMGAVSVLKYTMENGHSWLVIAVDEIAGQDVSGLRDRTLLARGITLEDVHDRTHAWAEAESLIGIRDGDERIKKGQAALGGLKQVFLTDPAIIRETMAKAGFFGGNGANSISRVIDSQITLDGQPAHLSYRQNSTDQVEESILIEETVETGGGGLLLFFAKTLRNSQRELSRVRFEAKGARYPNTIAAYNIIRDTVAFPPQIHVISATASED